MIYHYFCEERKIVYLKIIVTKNSETDDIVKASTIIRNKKQFETILVLFRDQTHGNDIYFINIKQRSHEMDWSQLANSKINDLKNNMGNIIYYPKDIELTPIQIVKGHKVFIEIKQNRTLLKLFGQMKKLIEDI